MKLISILLVSVIVIFSCTSIAPPKPVKNTQYWDNFRSEWIDLDSAKYRHYAIYNAQKFAESPEPIYKEGLEKWHGFFTHDTFPAAKVPDKNIKYVPRRHSETWPVDLLIDILGFTGASPLKFP